MTLDAAPAGVEVRVGDARLDPTMARRLAELGVRPGQTVTPLHRTAGGGRVVGIGETRVALARAVLRLVEVAG